ncbi:hypothetical protein BH24DEI2_BH24DEI2_09120 [soil metagenome]
MKTLGLDLGGTKIAAAVVEDGVILAQRRVATPQTGVDAVVAALTATATALLADHPEVRTFGVGSPGPLDLNKGMILFAPNIPGLQNAPLVARLQDELGLQVSLENDAKAAGYAEHRYGAARHFSSSIYITLSTGIGGGLFVGDAVGIALIPLGLHKCVTFYTWSSDQFSQYGSKAIPSTVRDATYVLDAVLDNETELALIEHTTDTSGFTELIFAVFDLLGLRFIPRIRDLKEQTLYRSRGLDLADFPTFAPCLTGLLQEDVIEHYWDEMLRFVGSLKPGYVTASLLVQKLQAYPRKHQLTRALQAYGRLPKTLHILRWYTNPALRKRAGLQLNEGEAIHDLRAYIAFANQGKIGTKTDEQLDHQVACLNLLSNIVIYWNTLSLQAAVDKLKAQGFPVQDEDLQHIWPTRYQHVNVYGTYSFDEEEIQALQRQRELA